MPKILMTVNTGFVACVHEDTFDMDDELWDSFNDSEKEAYLDQLAIDFLHERCGSNAKVIE